MWRVERAMCMPTTLQTLTLRKQRIDITQITRTATRISKQYLNFSQPACQLHLRN